MYLNRTTSLRDVAQRWRAAFGAQGYPMKWNNLALLIAVIILAATAMLAHPVDAKVQDDVLGFVQSQFGGYGLRSASAVVITPDDNHVYVASEQDDAVVHFTRAATGELVYIATYVNGENNVDGMNNPVALAVSPDGRNLYVAGKEADLTARVVNGKIAAFTRDMNSGALTFVETLSNNEGGIEKMFDPDAIAVTPDGKSVYVACDTALSVFRRNTNNGRLTFVEAEQGNLAGDSFQLRDVIAPDNSTVYVTAHLRNGIAVLSRDAGDQGKLTLIQTLQEGVDGVTGLQGAEKLAASSDGVSLYATGNISGTVAVFTRQGDGKLSYVETITDGEDGVDGVGGARSVTTSADNKNVYVAGVSDDALAVFTRDGAGKLSFVECFSAQSDTNCEKSVPGLKSPSNIALSADGASLYPTARASDSLSVYDRELGDGTLTLQNVLFDSDGGVPGLGGAFDAAVSPDGKHVYVAGSRDQSVAVFERDAKLNGFLSFVEVQKEGLGGVTGLIQPSSVTVSPDGAHVYVTSRDTSNPQRGSVVVFSRNMNSGVLSYVETLENTEDGIGGIAGAWQSAMSPDSKNLYVTGITDGTVATFNRDPSTGKLDEVQLQIDGVSGVNGLRGASGIDVSNDGKHVYVTGSDSDSVVVFQRDGPKGELTYAETKENGVDGVRGLDGAIDVDVSADGKNVYVSSIIDGVVSVFKRNSQTGRLTYLGVNMGAASEQDAKAEEAEQSTALLYWSLQESPDGKYVFAGRWEVTTSIFDPVGSIVVFARQPETGILSTAQVLRNDEGGVRGLREPTSVIVSPDSANVYATSIRDSAALVFEVVGSAEYTDVNYLPFISGSR